MSRTYTFYHLIILYFLLWLLPRSISYITHQRKTILYPCKQSMHMLESYCLSIVMYLDTTTCVCPDWNLTHLFKHVAVWIISTQSHGRHANFQFWTIIKFGWNPSWQDVWKVKYWHFPFVKNTRLHVCFT